MQVVVTEKARSFAHFITSVWLRPPSTACAGQCCCYQATYACAVMVLSLKVCAIIGGVFTVTGLVDSIVYHSSKVMKKD